MNADTPNDPETGRRKTSFHERIRSGFESARQMMQPGPYRIAAPCASEGLPLSETNAHAQDGKRLSTDDQLTLALKTLATVATAVWRAKTKLDSEARAELPDALRNLPRHIQAAWDALAAGQVQIDDPAGQRYVPGMAVNVLTFQPMEGIGSEIIQETIKPSVYFDNRLIQRADVIVARPVTKSDKPQPNDALPKEVPGQNKTSDEKGSNADGSDND
jgi:hypothetical protein